MPGLSAGETASTIKTLRNGRVGAVPTGRRSAVSLPDQQIRFTNPCWFRQPCLVRTSVPVWIFLLVSLSCLCAQDQERKLMDRLLKPDMTLQNDAQNKKFIA